MMRILFNRGADGTLLFYNYLPRGAVGSQLRWITELSADINQQASELVRALIISANC